MQILSRTLRDEREDWAKDRFDAFIDKLVSRTGSAEMLMKNGKLSIKPLAPAGRPAERAARMRTSGDAVVGLNNDHFPTGVFQRRIV